MTNEPKLLENLTRQQLADRLGVCLMSIKRWERAGRLKPTRYGPRTIRYPIAYVCRLESEGIPDAIPTAAPSPDPIPAVSASRQKTDQR